MITIEISQAVQIAEAAAGRPAHAKREYPVPPELVQRVIALGGEIDERGSVYLNGAILYTGLSGYTGEADSDGPKLHRKFGGSGRAVQLDTLPSDAAEAVAALEAVIAPHVAEWQRRRDEKAAKEAAGKAAREAREKADAERMAALTDDQILELRAARKKPTDSDTYQIDEHLDVLSAKDALGQERYDRIVQLIQQRASAAREAEEAAKKARANELRLRTRAILQEHAPQTVERFDAGVLPEAEAVAVLRGVLLAPFVEFGDYEKITATEVRDAEASEHDGDDLYDEEREPVEFDVEDVEDGEYECTAEQWVTITKLRKLAEKHGCTTTLRLHSGTTKAMKDYVRRLGMRVCCEYAPDKRVCRELAI